MSTLKVNAIQDTSGGGTTLVSAQNTAKAWVNVDGTGTVNIRGDYNVGSVTDNGTGDYTINFTTAMSDTNYCINLSAVYGSTTRESVRHVYTYSTTQVRVLTGYSYSSPGSSDADSVFISIFGD